MTWRCGRAAAQRLAASTVPHLKNSLVFVCSIPLLLCLNLFQPEELLTLQLIQLTLQARQLLMMLLSCTGQDLDCKTVIYAPNSHLKQFLYMPSIESGVCQGRNQ